MHDLRDAVRSLRSTPVVSLMAILSLALGIGANTAIFSILDSLFLRTLPVRDPHQLVILRDAAGRRTTWSNPMWEQIRERERLFDGAFAWAGAPLQSGAQWTDRDRRRPVGQRTDVRPAGRTRRPRPPDHRR